MISITGFSGEIPRMAPRLLPDSAAQKAINCRLVNGDIIPLRYPADYRILAPGNVMFYKRDAIWFEWNKVVDVVNAPIAANRLYFTGDGAPKIVTDDAVVYPLAVRAPAAALTAAVTGTPDPASQETVMYAYTYVTGYDEESEPSALSNSVLRSKGMDVTLSGFQDPPADRNYNRIRIYRSQTSATGSTDLYFIREFYLPVPTPIWVDKVEDNPIQETCPSIYYNPPPDDLQGIIALPNGMMAGFVGNKLYFSEPWLPHAWPEKYVLTTNYDIVGLGSFGHSIAVMTKGWPYIATGIAPDQMAMDYIEVNYPCLNKRGIVDLGYTIAYPSTDGLVTISENGAQLASRNLFTREQWQDLGPKEMIASQYDGRYICTDANGGTVIIDMTGDAPFLTRCDLAPSYMFYEIGSGRLFILDGQNAQEWDAPSEPYMAALWRSKKFVLDGDINMGAARVDGQVLNASIDPTAPSITVDDATISFDRYASDTQQTGAVVAPMAAPVNSYFEARVYCDGKLKHSFDNLGSVARLPGGFLARTWEIEIEGTVEASAANMAWTPSQFYVGAA